MNDKIKITVWNEFIHEKADEKVREIYPHGIHTVIAEFLSANHDFEVRTATLEEPEHGLSEAVLEHTDVLIWWGHMAHEQVKDEVVGRVQERILKGMGLIVLHSGHFSKIFKRMLGTSCTLNYRERGEKERLWIIEPAHPIAAGMPASFEIPRAEMYGERFDIPAPEQLVLVSWFEGGEVFRSGCCWQRGHGRIFYFRPGHEVFPIYYDEQVQRIITNAARWAKPAVHIPPQKG